MPERRPEFCKAHRSWGSGTGNTGNLDALPVETAFHLNRLRLAPEAL